MGPLQDPREHPARRDPPSAQHADLETGTGAEMPITPDAALLAARAHGEADEGVRDHALRLDSSGW